MKPTINAAVILEMRDRVAVRKGEEDAPAWAVHLAEAEYHDQRRALDQRSWDRVWAAADADVAWQGATDDLVRVAVDPLDPFFRSWVNVWVLRHFGVAVYADAAATLRHVHPRSDA